MPTTAGVPTVLLGYVEDQVSRGWHVSVICPEDGWLAERARTAGAEVLAWPATRGPGPGTVAETRRLATLLTRAAPDVVHLHSAKAGLAGRLALRGRRPTVFQPHAWSFLAVRGAVRRATVTWERAAARWTDAFVYVSAAEREQGAALGIAAPATVVPNGVDLTRIAASTAAAREQARRELGLGDGPLAVCVGRLCEQKGQHELLAAWPDVHAAVPGARLVLIGDGPERGALEAQRGARADVDLVGERSDVARWLAAATLAVAPSRWEGMALAPLEAMAAARSVVCTDVAGAAEAVPAGAGAVVPVADRERLVREMTARLADPAAADAEGRIGRAHVEAHHDAAQAAAAVVRTYESVLAMRSAR